MRAKLCAKHNYEYSMIEIIYECITQYEHNCNTLELTNMILFVLGTVQQLLTSALPNLYFQRNKS